MRTIKNVVIALAFIITLLTTGGAYADSSVIGGNIIIDRGSVDDFSDFYILDLNNPINRNGILKHWEIYAENTNEVQLVIYRQKGGVFSVVGRSEIETPVAGYNLFELDSNLIHVKAGDFIGFYNPDLGSVSYNLDPPTVDNFGLYNLTGTVLLTDADSGSDDNAAVNFLSSTNRHYSIRATQ